MNLAILSDATDASDLSYYLRETFQLDVKIEETFTQAYLLSVDYVSDYIMGFVDGIVHQYKLPILIKEKDEL